MKPLQKEFAELAGKILGRRWFNEQRRRAEHIANRFKAKEPQSGQIPGDDPELGKKQG